MAFVMAKFRMADAEKRTAMLAWCRDGMENGTDHMDYPWWAVRGLYPARSHLPPWWPLRLGGWEGVDLLSTHGIAQKLADQMLTVEPTETQQHLSARLSSATVARKRQRI